MAKLPIVTAPDPRLKVVCAPVAAVDDEVRRLMDDMLGTMCAAPGIEIDHSLATVVSGLELRTRDRNCPCAGMDA